MIHSKACINQVISGNLRASSSAMAPLPQPGANENGKLQADTRISFMFYYTASLAGGALIQSRASKF